MDDRTRVETSVADALIAKTTSFSSLPDAEVLTAVDELVARRLELDAAIARGMAEIASRSDHLPADESLVRRAGYGSVERLAQAKLGIRWHDAKQLVAVANATRAQVSLTGATLPIRSPHVASSLHSGWLSIAQAHAIIAGLAKAEGRASVEDVDAAEELLVTLACGTGDADTEPATPETLTTSAKRCVDYIDPDGDEPRFQDQLDARFLRFRKRRRGGYAFDGVCTDEQHEILASAFDAHVKPRRVQFQDLCGATDDPDSDPSSDQDAVDERTTEQRRLDALVTIVGRHAETTSPRIAGEAPTVTITVAASALTGDPDRLDDLATLNRSGDTVPVSIAARYICDSFIQAVVQDDDGHPLKLGRRQRLFSKAQRRAIIARDRHCRAPGCTAPPGWCETHHIEPWGNGGTTDVDNGILLCQHHHTEVHRGALTVRPATQAELRDDQPPAPAPETPKVRHRRRRWRITTAYPRRPRTRTPLRT